MNEYLTSSNDEVLIESNKKSFIIASNDRYFVNNITGNMMNAGHEATIKISVMRVSFMFDNKSYLEGVVYQEGFGNRGPPPFNK